MALGSELKPTTTGNLSERPFAQILVSLFENKMSGTLDMADERMAASIYFRDGEPAKIQTSAENRTLGEVMLRLGFVNVDQLKSCDDQMAGAGGVLGQTLIGLNAIDMKMLVRSLKAQMLIKLVDIFGMTDATYAFDENVNKLSGFGPDEVFPIHPFPVLMAGYREHGHRLDMTPTLSLLTDKWVSIEQELEVIRGFRLIREEKKVVGALLSGSRPFSALVQSADWTPLVGRYVVYVMLITKQLVVASDPSEQPIADPLLWLSTMPPPPRAPLDPELAALRDEVIDRAKSISTQSYYEMLGLSRDNSSEEARQAFFKLSKKFCPLWIPPELSSDIGEIAEYLFSNLKEAHAVLTEAESRRSYDWALDNGYASDIFPKKRDDSDVRNALIAESLFQRALAHLNPLALDKAFALLEEARILNPKESEYLALEWHLKALKRSPGAKFDDLVKNLRRLSEECPNSERVAFFLADVLKRAGMSHEARSEYQRILALNPYNIDAARELRFLEQKRRIRATPQKRDSFIKRIFK